MHRKGRPTSRKSGRGEEAISVDLEVDSLADRNADAEEREAVSHDAAQFLIKKRRGARTFRRPKQHEKAWSHDGDGDSQRTKVASNGGRKYGRRQRKDVWWLWTVLLVVDVFGVDSGRLLSKDVRYQERLRARLSLGGREGRLCQRAPFDSVRVENSK